MDTYTNYWTICKNVWLRLTHMSSSCFFEHVSFRFFIVCLLGRCHTRKFFFCIIQFSHSLSRPVYNVKIVACRNKQIQEEWALYAKSMKVQVLSFQIKVSLILPPSMTTENVCNFQAVAHFLLQTFMSFSNAMCSFIVLYLAFSTKLLLGSDDFCVSYSRNILQVSYLYNFCH